MYTVEAPKFISGKREINLFKYENLLVTGHWSLVTVKVQCGLRVCQMSDRSLRSYLTESLNACYIKMSGE